MYVISVGALRLFPLMFGLMALGGCAVVDQYGSRATEYNEQTSDSRNSAILLNIMRAAYREPLQFTDISTVTGTASATGGLNATLPLRVGGPHFTTTQVLSLNPSATLSGGPQFSVANLNTQAFFLGLQAPIKTETVRYYLDHGIDRKVLLPLVISKIQVDNSATETRSIVRPTGAALSYGVFPSAMRKLITSGLTVDEMKKPAKPETFGPVLTEQQAKDPKLLSALMQAVSSPRGGSSSAATGGSSSAAPESEGSFKLTELKDRPGNFQLTLTKPSTKALNFCFREESNLKGTPVSSDDAYIESNLSSGGLKPILLVSAEQGPILQFPIDTNSCISSKKSPVTINFETNSVEGIFTLLGEMVRVELGLGSEPPQILADPNGKPTFLFKVEQRLPSDGEISATIHGLPYVVSIDPSGEDASSQVIQLLSDLLAIQSNAKDFPAPNVIAVVP
jgi:hypothetical protein